MDNKNERACVFNVQTFSVHDGPGIRSTVFVKGCPLRCLWCHNPESHKAAPEIMDIQKNCIKCGACITSCPEEAISMADGKVITDREKCMVCGKCTEVCPSDARRISGKIRTASEVVQEALQDEIFMRTSGGGITVSGGEPLLYPEFTAAVLKETKARGLHTAIETCAYAKKSAIEKVLPYVDLFFVDLKAMDCKLHTELTRVGNEKILENVKFIAKHADKELIIRIPVIPEGNMSDENLEKTALFVKDELGQNIQVQLLPYHNYGDSKKENLGRNDIVSFRKPTEEEMEHAMDIFTKYGIAVQNGGFV